MDMMKIAAIALLGAFALLMFKQYKPEWGIPTRWVLGVALGGMILTGVSEILSFAHTLTAGNTLTSEMWQIILKALGIAFITETTAGICHDSGEGTMAMWVETAGKTAMLLLSLPLMGEVLYAVKTLLSALG